MSPTKSRLPSIFNPATQSPDDIVANFVIRLKEFDELFQAIKSDSMEHPPQHYMIQGQRGYGKSTLLLRLKIEIENDKDLQNWLIPVMFDEEQYRVYDLAGLWEEVIEILTDRDASYESLVSQIDSLYDAANPEEEIYNLLISELKKRHKKLVLFLDNFNDLIVKFSRKEKQRLREVLITSNDLRFIGASSAILESDYDYKEPFFDFFKAITLNELNREEIIQLLTRLGETYRAAEIQKIIKEQPERIDALRRLTGGVPRTVVLLFEIFVDDLNGDSFKDLEMILDRVTPLYKHRLDNLSTQQQAIIDAIAQNWDAISTKEIAARVRMPSKAISAQLQQLEKNQYIKKIPTSTKNYLYQISERFFNIYYLMRLGKRRNRNRVLWLVKFFEICCDGKELIERAKKHIAALREGRLYDKHAYYVSQALARTALPFDQQHELLEETKKSLTAQKSAYAKEVDRSHIDIFKEVIENVKKKDINEARKKLESDDYSLSEVCLILAELLRGQGDFPEAIEFYLEAVKHGDAGAMFNLALLYDIELKDFIQAEKYYKMAVERGDAEAMYNLALLYNTELKDFIQAEKYYKMAAKKNNSEAMFNLALLYATKLGNYIKAKKYYKMAIEKGDVEAMNNLALLYAKELNDYVQAEKYFKMAVEKDKVEAMNNLACLYFQLKKNKQEALQLQKAAYECEKDIIEARGYMTILLWNDEIEEAINLYTTFFDSEEMQREVNENISVILLMLLAKKQHNFVYNIFLKNRYDVREKYKPIYYALLSLLGEKYSDDLKKMGGELKESVQDVLNAINSMVEDFAEDKRDE